MYTIRYDTVAEFNVDSRAEYSALSSTRSQKLKRTKPVPFNTVGLQVKRSVNAVRKEQGWLWRKGFVKEMSCKSGVKGRGSDRWREQRWWLWWGDIRRMRWTRRTVTSVYLSICPSCDCVDGRFVYDRYDDGRDQNWSVTDRLQSSELVPGERVGVGWRSASYQLHTGRHSHLQPVVRQQQPVRHTTRPRRSTVLLRKGSTNPQHDIEEI